MSRLPIGVLKQIADTLGVHMNWFFHGGTEGPPEERDVVVRAANRRRPHVHRLGHHRGAAVAEPGRARSSCSISTIDPGADSEFYATTAPKPVW